MARAAQDMDFPRYAASSMVERITAADQGAQKSERGKGSAARGAGNPGEEEETSND